MRAKKILSAILVSALLVGLLPLGVLAVETEAKWYDAAMKTSVERGILKGNESGDLEPTRNITRGEFSVMLDRVMKYRAKSKTGFPDVKEGAFYTNAILGAAAAGILKGDDAGNANPGSNINRQEAALMIARIMKLDLKGAPTGNFADQIAIAPWATGAVNAMKAAGYMGAKETSFRPTDYISRAEVATVLSNILVGYFNEAKTYTGDVAGSAVVNADGATLKNMKIAGDLIIAEGVAEGTVYLDGVTIGGKLLVRGGGVNSIYIKGASKVGTVTLAKIDGKVRVVVEGSAEVEVVVVDDGSDDVKLEGTIGTVTVDAKDVKVTITGTVAKVENTEYATGTTIEATVGARIATVTANGAGTQVIGSGKVDMVAANANDIKVTTPNTKVEAAEGTTGVTAGGKPVEPGKPGMTPKAPVDDGGSVSYDFTVIVNSAMGGRVTASVTQTNTPGQVILTVTPDPQKGTTMPYVLKSLTVKVPSIGDVDVTNDKLFRLAPDYKGTYTVTPVFEQPITAAALIVVNDAASYDKFKGYGYEADQATGEAGEKAAVVNAPWLALGIKRGEGYTGDDQKLALSNVTITANGNLCNNPNSWQSTSIGKYIASYVDGRTSGDNNPDTFSFDGAAAIFTATFRYQGMDYTLTSGQYVKPGVDEATLHTVKFGTVQTYKVGTGETVYAPEAPEAAGKKFKGWKWQDTAGPHYLKPGQSIIVSIDYDFTPEYVTITAQTVTPRRDGHPNVGDNYLTTYNKVGAFSNGNKTYTVDYKTFMTFVSNPENEKDITTITHKNIAYVGFEFPVPVDAAKLILLGGTNGERYEADAEFDLSTSINSNLGDIIVEGTKAYVDYIPMLTEPEAVFGNTCTYNFDWYDGTDILIASTAVTVERKITLPTYTVHFKDDDKVLKTVRNVSYADINTEGYKDWMWKNAPTVTKPDQFITEWEREGKFDPVADSITFIPTWEDSSDMLSLPGGATFTASSCTYATEGNVAVYTYTFTLGGAVASTAADLPDDIFVLDAMRSEGKDNTTCPATYAKIKNWVLDGDTYKQENEALNLYVRVDEFIKNHGTPGVYKEKPYAVNGVLDYEFMLVPGKHVKITCTSSDGLEKWVFNITNNISITAPGSGVASVYTAEKLIAALADESKTTINLLADSSDILETIEVNRPVTINGNGKALSFGDLSSKDNGKRNGLVITSNAVTINDLTVAMTHVDGWKGIYGVQVYNANANGVTLYNYTGTGGDAALLVNGSQVTLTGTTTVSDNEFGGIEVAKGSDLVVSSTLIISGRIVNDTESADAPSIWVVKGQGSITGSRVAELGTGVEKAEQTHYFIDPVNRT